MDMIAAIAELSQNPQWVTWRYDGPDKRKTPYNAHTGRPAKSNDPTTWSSYDVAQKACSERNHSGIGYVFVPDDGLVGIDLDDCINDGQMQSWAAAIIEKVDSYTEISPSGHGVKLWIRGRKPEKGINLKGKHVPPTLKPLDAPGGIEIYGERRYFTVTGEHLGGTPTTINDADLDWLYAILLPDTPLSHGQNNNYPQFTSTHLVNWKKHQVQIAIEKIQGASEGEFHKARWCAARLLGGLVAHHLITEQEAIDLLLKARPPAHGSERKEEKVIRDGIESGKGSPLKLPEKQQPSFDAKGYALCPICNKRLKPARNGNGYRCLKPGGILCYWWEGEGYQYPGKKEPPALAAEGDSSSARELMKHPETGEAILLPHGYGKNGQTIERWGRGVIYQGVITITSTGYNIHNAEEWVTVEWNGKGHHGKERISRADLGSGESLRKILAARGAAIHARNTSEISNFLSDLIQENWARLPRREYVDRFGIVGDENVLILPAGSIGRNIAPIYTGSPITVGYDTQAYPEILRQIEGWSQTRVIWLLIGLSLASPALARMQADRNPVVYIGGSSGSGKTTVAHFAMGLYAPPSHFTVQCGSGTTTRVGIQQAISRACGVPVFLEDVHAMLGERDQAKKITGTIYDYGNRQGRFTGTIDGRGRGGEKLGGTLFMAGEMLPEFIHAGQQARTFTLDCRDIPPLGAPARSSEGQNRAQVLKSASSGYGLFGLSVNRQIWENWNAFIGDVERSAPSHLGAWGTSLATAAVALRIAFDLAEIKMSYDFPKILLRDWGEMLQRSQQQRDPVQESYDKIILMLAQSRMAKHDDLPSWEILEYRQQMVAARRLGENCWRVPTGGVFEEIVGTGQVFQHGQAWLEQGFIAPHTGMEKVSAKVRCGRALLRALLIPKKYVPAEEIY